MSLSVSKRGYLLRWDERRDVSICASRSFCSREDHLPATQQHCSTSPLQNSWELIYCHQPRFPGEPSWAYPSRAIKPFFIFEVFWDVKASCCPPTSAGQTCSNNIQKPSCAAARCAPLLQDLKGMRPEGPRGLRAFTHTAGFAWLILTPCWDWDFFFNLFLLLKIFSFTLAKLNYACLVLSLQVCFGLSCYWLQPRSLWGGGKGHSTPQLWTHSWGICIKGNPYPRERWCLQNIIESFVEMFLLGIDVRFGLAKQERFQAHCVDKGSRSQVM